MLFTLFVVIALIQQPVAKDGVSKKAGASKKAGTLERSDTIKKLVRGALEKDDKSADVSKLPFTSRTIKKIVLSHLSQVQGCYEEYLSTKSDKDKRGVEGLIKAQWHISGEGFVENLKILRRGSTLYNRNLNDCVIAVLSTMNFPQPPGGARRLVQFPFNLKAVR